MKRIVLAVAGFGIAVSFLWAGVVSAANVRTGDAPRVSVDETIDGTLYAAGKDLKVEGTVKGDVMCAGQDVVISGTVEGDVICAGQTVTVSGHVEGDVRVAGQTVTVSGKVDGSATMLGSTADVTSAGSVARDLTITSQQSTIEGMVGRDIEAIVGQNFTLNSKVGRDLEIISPNATLNDKTTVAGNFAYTSEANAKVAEGAHVGGQTTHKQPETKNESQAMSPVAYLKAAGFGFLCFLVLGLALLLLVPRGLQASADALQASPVGTVGAGLVGVFVLPFIALLALVTLVGIPLGLLLFFVWISSMLVGLVVSAQCLGNVIVRRMHWQDRWQHALGLLVGLVIIFLLSLIPFVGGFVMFASVVWGAGAVWYSILKHRHPTGGLQEAKK